MTTPGAGLAGGPSEITGLASARAYAAGMREAFSSAACGAEAFAARLDGHGVHGPAVAAVGRAQELTLQAGAAWAQASGALDRQTVVTEAYAVAPEAGSKRFLTETGGAGGAVPTNRPPADPAASAGRTAGEQAEDAVLDAHGRLKVADTSAEAQRIRAEAEAIRRRRQPAPTDNPYTGRVHVDDLDLDPEEPLAEVAQVFRWTAQMYDDKTRTGDERAVDDALFWHAAADAVEAAAAAEPPASRAPGPDHDEAGLRRWRADELVLAQAQELYGDEDTPEAARLQRDADAVIRRRRQAHRAAIAAGTTPCPASWARDVPCVHPDGDRHAGLCFAADGGSWPRHASWAVHV